jgi:hypothetical protein
MASVPTKLLFLVLRTSSSQLATQVLRLSQPRNRTLQLPAVKKNGKPSQPRQLWFLTAKRSQKNDFWLAKIWPFFAHFPSDFAFVFLHSTVHLHSNFIHFFS